jgi:hypothetical protein
LSVEEELEKIRERRLAEENRKREAEDERRRDAEWSQQTAQSNRNLIDKFVRWAKTNHLSPNYRKGLRAGWSIGETYAWHGENRWTIPVYVDRRGLFRADKRPIQVIQVSAVETYIAAHVDRTGIPWVG